MTTQGKFTFKYGRLEARAKIPAGDWLWPGNFIVDYFNYEWSFYMEIDKEEIRVLNHF